MINFFTSFQTLILKNSSSSNLTTTVGFCLLCSLQSPVFQEETDYLYRHSRDSTKANPTGNYMFKVNNRNTRKRCKICSKLTIKTPERSHCRRAGAFIINFEQISYLFLVFLLLNLKKLTLAGKHEVIDMPVQSQH